MTSNAWLAVSLSIRAQDTIKEVAHVMATRTHQAIFFPSIIGILKSVGASAGLKNALSWAESDREAVRSYIALPGDVLIFGQQGCTVNELQIL
jgi:hypothetical protein